MKNKIYKILRLVTLTIPIPLYLFLTATLFNIEPDYIIYDADVTTFVRNEYEDGTTFIYDEYNEASYKGLVDYFEDVRRYGVWIDDDTIIKNGNNYYSLRYDDETGLREWADVKTFAVEEKNSYAFPIVFFVSLFGVVIVGLVISKKMNWHKDYPKVAVLVSLIVGTATLYLLNTIIGGILGVFVVATISWSAYLLEELIFTGKIKENDRTDKLAKAIKELS